MNEKTKIVLADEHLIVRIALCRLISDYNEFTVVGSVSKGKELIELLKTRETDLVLLDIEMHQSDGIETLKFIGKKHPRVKVIILSARKDTAYINTALNLGAKGYLTKSCSQEELYNCLLNVSEKGFFLPESVSNKLLEYNLDTRRKTPTSLLSKREIEIIREICSGKSEKEIALHLHISHNTVHKHRENIYQKTNSHNTADILRYAFHKGLFEPDF